MKAVVDPDTCIGCGLCISMCPDVFQMNDDGKAEEIVGDLNDSQSACARDAASSCPVEAIHLK